MKDIANEQVTSRGDGEEVINLFRDILHLLLESSIDTWLELQISLPQLRALFAIVHQDKASLMLVAKYLGIGKAAASNLIDKLVRAGLVERREDETDRRFSNLTVTAEGQRLIQGMTRWEGRLISSFASMPKEELAALRRALGSLTDGLRVGDRS